MKPHIQKHSGVFLYKQKEIPFYYWSHATKANPVDTVIFLGTSQTGRIARWVAGNAPAGTVVIEGLPHKVAQQDASDLKEFAYNYSVTAFLAAQQALNIRSAHLIGESQSALATVWVALSHIKLVKNVALIAPLGFNSHVFGDSPQERLKKLKQRAFLSATQFAQSPLYDWRNLYLGSLMLHAILHDARWSVSGQKYAAGVSYDARQDCRELASQLHKKGNHITFILGERDKLFPAKEIVDSIQSANIKSAKTIILRTSHASLAIRSGKHILQHAVSAVRGQNVAPEASRSLSAKR